jgi:hypothetical protein
MVDLLIGLSSDVSLVRTCLYSGRTAVVFCWLQGTRVPTSALLSITVTGTHTYGTLLGVFYTLLSNFCSSTYHKPEIHFTLSTPSVYFSLLYFIPCE